MSDIRQIKWILVAVIVVLLAAWLVGMANNAGHKADRQHEHFVHCLNFPNASDCR